MTSRAKLAITSAAKISHFDANTACARICFGVELEFVPLVHTAALIHRDQTSLLQSQALKSAGCVEIHEEQASGGNRARPVLARAEGVATKTHVLNLPHRLE